MKTKTREKFKTNKPLEFKKKTKYIEKFDNFNFNIEKIKAEFLTIFYEIKVWSKDDPDLYDFNAICVNQKPNDPKSISGGNLRGKYWTYPKSDWNEEERLININEAEYTEVCSPFKDTYIEEVYNIIKSKWRIGRMRFLMKPPRSCLSWHRDPEKRIHVPIITNPGCRMVIEDESYHMPADGSVYITDNSKYHNFFNGGETDRLHLVATLIE
tara:strand:- start:113 stop:748 length:636 start_codon:yes stop_codon:yes gene_type:complete